MQLIKLLDPYDIEAVIQPLINDGYTVQCTTRVNDCRMLIVLNRPRTTQPFDKSNLQKEFDEIHARIQQGCASLEEIKEWTGAEL